MERKVPLKFKNADGTFTTLPDEARQLVGYDYDGNEIYEADRLFRACDIRRGNVNVPWRTGYPRYKTAHGTEILKIIDNRNYYGEKAMLLPCAAAEDDNTFSKHIEWFLVEKNGEYGGKLLGAPEDVKKYLVVLAERDAHDKSKKKLREAMQKASEISLF